MKRMSEADGSARPVRTELEGRGEPEPALDYDAIRPSERWRAKQCLELTAPETVPIPWPSSSVGADAVADARLVDALVAALAKDARLAGANLRVDARGGHAVLRGALSEKQEHRLTGILLRGVEGLVSLEIVVE